MINRFCKPSTSTLYTLILFLFPGLFSGSLHAQSDISGSFQTPASFVKNVGQFDGRIPGVDPAIEYAIDYNEDAVLFTKGGIFFHFSRSSRIKEKDKSIRRNISEVFSIQWELPNEDVEIIPETPVQGYYSYGIKDNVSGEIRNSNHIVGYSKLTFKNLYDNIDVQYFIHPVSGFEFNVILHPGADESRLKMIITEDVATYGNGMRDYFMDAYGEIQLQGIIGKITIRKPGPFYSETRNEIYSEFKLESSELSFNIGDHDATKEVTIDPWIVSPDFTTSSAVWNVETDQYGNVYATGGETPMQLKKYDSLGNLQWTYTTPWDTAGYWLGALVTDKFGHSYITSGTNPEIEHISPDGSMIWHNDGLSTMCEYWTGELNCDQSSLVVGGTYLDDNFNSYAALFYIDTLDGSVKDSVLFEYRNLGGTGSAPEEVRAICSAKNSKYIYLTHQTIGRSSQSVENCVEAMSDFRIDNNHHLAYKCENFLPYSQNGGGLNALTSYGNSIYIHAGDRVYKRSFNSGGLIDSVVLDGGVSFEGIYGGYVLGNCGIESDSCGNIYVGMSDRVFKLDSNLNILAQESLTFFVYDLALNSNGGVIVAGAQQNNGSVNRNGRIQSLDMGACKGFEPECCNLAICTTGTICIGDSEFNLLPETAGGVFSGDGITDANAGTFNPAVAGSGAHTITYTLPCGSEDFILSVYNCEAIAVCKNDTIAEASGGSADLLWYILSDFNYTIQNEQQCTDCPAATPIYYMGIYISCDQSVCTGSGYVLYDTGYAVTMPAAWPLMVTDGVSNTLIINSADDIPFCFTSGEEIGNEDKLVRVYPNPFKNNLNVELFSEKSEPVEIRIYNLLGEELLVVRDCVKGHGSCILEIQNLERVTKEGTYLLKIKIGGNTYNKLVVK